MSNDACIHCGREAATGSLECHQCIRKAYSDESMTKTPESIIHRYMPVLQRAARAMPAKLVDRQAVHDLARIGLGEHLMRLTDVAGCNPGNHQELIKAIAAMRVLVEKLMILHCDTTERADALRFYLEQEARAQEPAQGADRNG